MSDVQSIILEIRRGSFTNDEINELGRAVQYARSRLRHEIKQDLRPGLTVYFKDRLGRRIVGQVDSVKIKNAVVSTANGRYRVPCNMLEMS